jgi:hypothetical protein
MTNTPGGPTPTNTPAGPAPTATNTGVATNGTLQIPDGRPFPNPNPAEFRVFLDGPSDEVVVKVYTVNMQLIEVLKRSSASNVGCVSVAMPRSLVDKMGSGTYYFQADAKRGQTKALKPWVGTFVYLK